MGTRSNGFLDLCKALARELKGRRCVVDGEIVCLDFQGKPYFKNLLFRRAEPVFYAFDTLWDEHARSDDDEEMRRFRNGEDTRYLPLIDRKEKGEAFIPTCMRRRAGGHCRQAQKRLCTLCCTEHPATPSTGTYAP
jgi:ATP-dependent DNA ligase